MASSTHQWDKKSFQWNLTPKSMVIEVGGFHGRWAKEINERYHPQLVIYEPQTWLAEELSQTFVNDTNVTVKPYGLGTAPGKCTMYSYGTDGCSFIKGNETALGPGTLVEANMELAQYEPIDVMLINIEGYEYKLIPHLINEVCDCGNEHILRAGKRFTIRPLVIMVQFHLFDYSDEIVEAHTLCRSILNTYYNLKWDYGTTLSAWVIKKQYLR